MRQRHQVPAWQRTTVPHPAFRGVSYEPALTATNVAPARNGITVSRAGPAGMMLAQHARSAPDHTHLVRQSPAPRNSSGGSR